MVDGAHAACAATADHHLGNGREHSIELFNDQQHVLMAHVMELGVPADAVRIDVGLYPAAEVGIAGAVEDEDPVPVAHGVDVRVRREHRGAA